MAEDFLILFLGFFLGILGIPPTHPIPTCPSTPGCAHHNQASVFPVLFAAAAHFEDGRVHIVAELKGIEYGCTVDAVAWCLHI